MPKSFDDVLREAMLPLSKYKLTTPFDKQVEDYCAEQRRYAQVQSEKAPFRFKVRAGGKKPQAGNSDQVV